MLIINKLNKSSIKTQHFRPLPSPTSGFQPTQNSNNCNTYLTQIPKLGVIIGFKN